MKKKFLFLILMLVMFVMPVMADELTTNCVGSNDMNCGVVTYDDEMYVGADDSVAYSKKANGTILLAGNMVTYDGSNDGIAMLAGNNVKSKGYSDYALLAGNSIDVTAAVIEKDLFIAGNIINVDATIYRDAVIVGSNIKISGHIERNLTIYGSNVTLENVNVSGNVKIMADTVVIKDDVIINGKLTYGVSNISISGDATIGLKEQVEVNTYKFTFLDTLKGRAISYASLLFVFVILALLIPSSLKNAGDEELSFTQIVTYIGYALVFLILVPISALILMMLTIGFPVAIMMLAIYFAAIYLSYAYMGYYVGKKIWLSKNKDENVLLEGLIGITILYLISLIPTVGPIITFIAYLCGLGIIIFKFKK